MKKVGWFIGSFIIFIVNSLVFNICVEFLIGDKKSRKILSELDTGEWLVVQDLVVEYS